MLRRRSFVLINGAMSEADKLAHRFFALWGEYLTALIQEPKTAEPLRQWLTMAAGALPTSGDAELPSSPRSAAPAATSASASSRSDAAVVELTRRVDELVERVAAL